MSTEFKQMHIKLPLPVYEAFYRKYPGRGERTKFILSKICEEVAGKLSAQQNSRRVFMGKEKPYE